MPQWAKYEYLELCHVLLKRTYRMDELMKREYNNQNYLIPADDNDKEWCKMLKLQITSWAGYDYEPNDEWYIASRPYSVCLIYENGFGNWDSYLATGSVLFCVPE